MCCHKIPRKEVIHPIPTAALLTQKENKGTHFHIPSINTTIFLSCAEPSTRENIPPSSKGIPTMKASSLLPTK